MSTDKTNSQETLEQAIYDAVKRNETSGIDANAYRIIKPNPTASVNGQGGWTIGFDQEDFNTNPIVAQQTLINALVASNKYNFQEAESIAQSLTDAGTTTTVNFNINDVNAALQTSAAEASIAKSSENNFDKNYYNLENDIFNNDDLNDAVKKTLDDPVYGATLKTILADYNNQYNLKSNGSMMELLTTGSTSLGGDEHKESYELDTSSSTGVITSVMDAILGTKWSASGNEQRTCYRLTNDIQEINNYFTQNDIQNEDGVQSIQQLDIQGAFGQCEITSNETGTKFTGVWSDGSNESDLSSMTYNVSTTTTAEGQSNTDISGTGGVFSFNSDNVCLEEGASATINGNNNTFNISDFSKLYSSGDQNNVCIARDDVTASFSGQGNAVTIGDGTDAPPTFPSGQCNSSGNDSTSSFSVETSSSPIDGMTNVVISGDGATVNVNSASVSLMSETNAYINGYKNFINTYDDSSVLINGDANSFVAAGDNNNVGITGNDNTINISGSLNSLNDTGNNESVKMDGVDNTVSFKGNESSFNLTGDETEAEISGNNNTASIQGVDSSTSMTGSKLILNLSGDSSSASVNGDDNVVNVQGVVSSTYVEGNNAVVTQSGDGTSATIYSDDSLVNVQGAASSTYVEGNNAVVTQSGDGASATIYGDDSVVNVQGDGSSTYISGNNTIVTQLGDGTSAAIFGSDSVANVQGDGSSTYISGNNTIVTQLGDGTSATIFGSDSVANVQGDGSSTYIEGNDASVTQSGNSICVTISGDASVVNAQGINSSTTVIGNKSAINSSGDGASVSIIGDDNAACIQGNGNNIYLSGNIDNVSTTGNNTTTNVFGEGNNINTVGNDEISNTFGNNNVVSVIGDDSSSNLFGDNISTSMNGNNNIETYFGDDGSINTIGENGYIYTSGTGSLVTAIGDQGGADIFGNGNSIDIVGDSWTTNAFGNGNSVSLIGDDNTINNFGNDSDVNLEGDNANIYNSGNDNSVSVDGNEETAITTGDSNTTNFMGNNDSISTYGSDDMDFVDGIINNDDSLTEDNSNNNDSFDMSNTDIDNSSTDYTTNNGVIGDDNTDTSISSSDQYDDEGNTGFAGSQQIINRTLSSEQNPIYQYDISIGDQKAASANVVAMQHDATIASGLPQDTDTSAFQLEGAKWNDPVVSWSLANSAGTLNSPFSSYMNSNEEILVQQAFSSWSQVAGISFQEVSDTSQSDIRIGWGDFDTANTGLVGYTSFDTQAGQIQPDVIVRLEDPSETSLVNNGTSQETYTGTDASVEQVLTHEIGHALGLDCNSDPNSVMYYKLSSANQSLDTTDIAGIQELYPSTDISNLVQVMANFNSSTGAVITQSNTAQQGLTQPLFAVSST
jgi:Predicted Zn-dependent protease